MKNNCLYISLLGMVLLAGACGKEQPADQQPAAETHTHAAETVVLSAEAIAKVGLRVGQIGKENVPYLVECTGVLDVSPQNYVSVHPPVNGFVQDIRVIQGQAVRKGEVLAVLQHPDYVELQRQYLAVTAQLPFLKAEYERQQQLSTENASAKKNFEKARSDYDMQKAEYAALAAKLRLAGINPDKVRTDNIVTTVQITAPFNGYVGVLNVNAGKFVSTDQEILTVINRDHWHAELQVFEQDIALLRENQNALVFVPQTDKPLHAHIKMIGQLVDPATKTVTIHGHLEESPAYLRRGMYVTAQIAVNNEQSWAVPADAVVREGDAYFVFVQRTATTFEQIQVSVGEESNGLYPLRSPSETILQQKIVVKGANYLAAEMNKGEAGHED